jgi:hypothetical protein
MANRICTKFGYPGGELTQSNASPFLANVHQREPRVYLLFFRIETLVFPANIEIKYF